MMELRFAAMMWVPIRDWLEPQLFPLVDELESLLTEADEHTDTEPLHTLSSEIGRLDLALIYGHPRQAVPPEVEAEWHAKCRGASDSQDASHRERLYLEAMDVLEAEQERNFRYLRCWVGLKEIAYEKRQDAVAAKYQQRISELYSYQFGSRHPRFAIELESLARAQVLARDFVLARKSFELGLSLLEESVGPRNVHYGLAQVAYADLLRKLGEDEAASRAQAEGAAAMDAWFDPHK